MNAYWPRTIKVSTRQVFAAQSFVIQEGIASPRDPVVCWKSPRPLRLVKEERLWDDGGIIVLQLSLRKDDAGQNHQK